MVPKGFDRAEYKRLRPILLGKHYDMPPVLLDELIAKAGLTKERAAELLLEYAAVSAGTREFVLKYAQGHPDRGKADGPRAGSAPAGSGILGVNFADVETRMMALRLFRISSRATLPARLKGTFSFEEAHRLCCSWNSWHAVEDVACPEEDAPGATWRTSENAGKATDSAPYRRPGLVVFKQAARLVLLPDREGTSRLVRNAAKVAALAVLALHPAQGRDPLGRLQRRRFRHSLPLRQDRPGKAVELNGAAIGRKPESAPKINTSFSGLYSTFFKSSR